MTEQMNSEEAEFLRTSINQLGRAWMAWSQNPKEEDGKGWEAVWARIYSHESANDMVLNIVLNLAHLAVEKEADRRGVPLAVGENEMWHAEFLDDPPPHHQILVPVLSFAANDDPKGAADVVLAHADPSNDWVLKTIGELLVLATDLPGPPGFFDMSFVVEDPS